MLFIVLFNLVECRLYAYYILANL